MQITFKVTELSSQAYFSSNADTFESARRPDAVSIYWTPVPGTKLRVTLLMAPANQAWGMQFRHRAALHEAIEAKLGDDRMAQSMLKAFELLGINLSTVPGTLMGCPVFGLEQQFEVGQQVADMSHATFRSVLLPDDDQEFQRFIDRVGEHIEQLGSFFLLPVPASACLSSWAEEEDERLKELFYRPPRGRQKGERMDGHLQAIRLALQGVEGAEAEQWLTPRFLEWEQVRPSYPLPAAPSTSKRALAFFDVLNLRPMGELLDQKHERTLLQLQLMKKWRWPLGLRTLFKAQTSKDLRQTLLGTSDSWEPAEVLVSELIEEANCKYPVLFT